MKVDNQPALAISELVARHHADVYRYAYRLCGRAADAEDLSQQVFLVACQKLDQLRRPDSARAWLLAIARNCYWRNCERRRMITAADIDLDVNDQPDESTSAQSNGAIDEDVLRQALDRLPPEFRVVITMFYYEELSYRQIATALDLPEGTVMSRLSRAKSRLRNSLNPQPTSDSPRSERRADRAHLES